MTNNFCKFLSNQIRVEYGQLRPCCWFTESVDITSADEVRQYQQQLSEITDWKSAGNRCNECKTREQKNLFSPRLQSLEHQIFKSVDDDSKVSIEIQIDRDCNAACLICGPWNSTTWEKYDNKIKNIPIQQVGDPKIASLEFVDQLSKTIDFSNAQEIRFLGGEPLRTDSHIRLLENVTHPENTVLRYTTNGSYRPNKKTLDTWKKFKMVILQCSIDGIGEHFNYLRWPLQWSQVEDNLKFLLELPDENIHLATFSYTTTPFSLYYNDVYTNWAEEFFKGTKYQNMFKYPWQPRGDTPMKLSAISPRLQQLIREKYGADHPVTKLLEPFNIKQYARFMEYIVLHDKHRQTNWRDVFPEISDYIMLT